MGSVKRNCICHFVLYFVFGVNIGVDSRGISPRATLAFGFLISLIYDMALSSGTFEGPFCDPMYVSMKC